MRMERRIIGLRLNRRWSPAGIAHLLWLHPSTVHKVLTRYGMGKLVWLDSATGQVIRHGEHHAPADLVHVDAKKLGRACDGRGHKIMARAAGNRNRTKTEANRRPGFASIPTGITLSTTTYAWPQGS